MKSYLYTLLFAVLFALTPLAAFGYDPPAVGAVYTMSNAPEGNEIVVFDRDASGHLSLNGAYTTAGLGTGGGIDPLASQGSLILSRNRHWLVAVNAGSDDVSVFRVGRHGLDLVGAFASGGPVPVSVALDRNLLYVLNAGQEGSGANITGFRLNRYGELIPLDGSTRELAGGGYHQVGFTPHGNALIVTQGSPAGPNAIHVFGIDEDGLPDATATVSASAGIVPFGFVFDWRNHLIVAEAGSGAVSSYAVHEDHTLTAIDASVPNGNRATCWIVLTWRGDVITANTGSDNLSLYRVAPADGEVQLVDSAAGLGDKPIDMAATRSGRFLYVLNAGDGSVGAFHISRFGGIRDLGAVPGLPPLFSQGIAVR